MPPVEEDKLMPIQIRNTQMEVRIDRPDRGGGESVTNEIN